MKIYEATAEITGLSVGDVKRVIEAYYKVVLVSLASVQSADTPIGTIENTEGGLSIVSVSPLVREVLRDDITLESVVEIIEEQTMEL